MIRRTKININYSNKNKLQSLDVLFEESKRVINEFIKKLWEKKDFSSKFINFKIEDSWISARLQQCLGKQALEIIKSQRKKKKKSIPVFDKNVINLDQRFIDVQFDKNSFDIWIKLISIGNKIILKLPSKKHKHFHKFNSWKLNKSCRLIKFDGNYFFELFFENEIPQKKNKGKIIGLDCGYKKLLISSENKIYDSGLEQIYEKISKKKQGSLAFKRALKERDIKINESVNKINLSEIQQIIIEDLKNVKKNSKRKIFKKFNNKLQRWPYSKVLDRLNQHCEEQGITFIKVNPSYTSQICSSCGSIHNESRLGENYKCIECGFEIDADLNAAINILQRGVYSPSSTKKT